MKKLLATILALVMAIGVTTTAWADGEGTTANVAKSARTGMRPWQRLSRRHRRARPSCCRRMLR